MGTSYIQCQQGEKKKKLQNGQFSYVMWQLDMGEEHKSETWSKLGTKNPKVQSKGPKKGHPKKKKMEKKEPGQNWAQKTPKFKAKGQKRATPKKKKKGKKKKKKCTYKDICSLEKLC